MKVDIFHTELFTIIDSLSQDSHLLELGIIPAAEFPSIPPFFCAPKFGGREGGGGKEGRKEKRRKDKEKWLKRTKMYINFLARALSRARLVMV